MHARRVELLPEGVRERTRSANGGFDLACSFLGERADVFAFRLRELLSSLRLEEKPTEGCPYLVDAGEFRLSNRDLLVFRDGDRLGENGVEQSEHLLVRDVSDNIGVDDRFGEEPDLPEADRAERGIGIDRDGKAPTSRGHEEVRRMDFEQKGATRGGVSVWVYGAF